MFLPPGVPESLLIVQFVHPDGISHIASHSRCLKNPFETKFGLPKDSHDLELVSKPGEPPVLHSHFKDINSGWTDREEMA